MRTAHLTDMHASCMQAYLPTPLVFGGFSILSTLRAILPLEVFEALGNI